MHIRDAWRVVPENGPRQNIEMILYDNGDLIGDERNLQRRYGNVRLQLCAEPQNSGETTEVESWKLRLSRLPDY